MSIATTGIVHDKQGRRYLSKARAAERLGVSYEAVGRMYRRGTLRGRPLGTSRVVHVLEADVELIEAAAA